MSDIILTAMKDALPFVPPDVAQNLRQAIQLHELGNESEESYEPGPAPTDPAPGDVDGVGKQSSRVKRNKR